MDVLKVTRMLAIVLTMVNAVLWTYQGYRIAGIAIALVAIAAAKWLPED